MGRLVRVRGAGAVRVAGDELLPLLAFVVHRVAQSARQRHQEANERDAKNEDAAGDVQTPVAKFQSQGFTLSCASRAPPKQTVEVKRSSEQHLPIYNRRTLVVEPGNDC